MVEQLDRRFVEEAPQQLVEDYPIGFKQDGVVYQVSIAELVEIVAIPIGDATRAIEPGSTTALMQFEIRTVGPIVRQEHRTQHLIHVPRRVTLFHIMIVDVLELESGVETDQVERDRRIATGQTIRCIAK